MPTLPHPHSALVCCDSDEVFIPPYGFVSLLHFSSLGSPSPCPACSVLWPLSSRVWLVPICFFFILFTFNAVLYFGGHGQETSASASKTKKSSTCNAMKSQSQSTKMIAAAKEAFQSITEHLASQSTQMMFALSEGCPWHGLHASTSCTILRPMGSSCLSGCTTKERHGHYRSLHHH